MNRIFFFILFLLGCYSASAQVEEISRRQAVKVNLHLDFSNPEQHILIGQPAPALVLRGEGHIGHEFELTRFSIDRHAQQEYDSLRQVADTSITKVLDLGIRYQFDLFLFKDIHKLNPYIGLSQFVGFTHSSYQPGSPTQYPVNSTVVDLELQVVPGIQMNLNRRLFIDVSAPIGALAFQYDHGRIMNPVWSRAEQAQHRANFDGLPVYQVKGILGLGLRF